MLMRTMIRFNGLIPWGLLRSVRRAFPEIGGKKIARNRRRRHKERLAIARALLGVKIGDLLFSMRQVLGRPFYLEGKQEWLWVAWRLVRRV